MKSKTKLMLKMIYVLIPRIIRQQLLEDPIYLYKEVLKKAINKIKKGKKSSFTLVNKIEELGCNYEIVFNKSNRTNIVSKPKLFIDGKSYFKPEISGKLPDINIYKLYNVSVLGSTDAIIYNNKFLHFELNLMESWHDLKRCDIFTKIDAQCYDLNLKYNNKILASDKNKKYISLLKEHSINYYHFMTEGLPRLIQIMELLEKFDVSNYSLLIDDEMPKQCLEAINFVVNFDIEIIFIKKGEIFHCDELIYCTPLWTSLDNTISLPNPRKEFFVDKYAINLVKDRILSSYSIKSKDPKRTKKVYLQRINTKLRPIKNIYELEMFLLKNNFEFVDVGSLNLKEQIELFQTVDIVIGASGAAFTNLIFMKENSVAINLYPSVSATNYYVFEPLSNISNVELIHFLTTPSTCDLSVHSEVLVDLNSLNLLLEEIENGKLCDS